MGLMSIEKRPRKFITACIHLCAPVLKGVAPHFDTMCVCAGARNLLQELYTSTTSSAYSRYVRETTSDTTHSMVRCASFHFFISYEVTVPIMHIYAIHKMHML